MTRVDDLMSVTIIIDFHAKAASTRPVDVGCMSYEATMLPTDAAVFMETIIDAINEERLFGWMQQESATGAIEAGDWVGKTIEDQLAEMKGPE